MWMETLNDGTALLEKDETAPCKLLAHTGGSHGIQVSSFERGTEYQVRATFGLGRHG